MKKKKKRRVTPHGRRPMIDAGDGGLAAREGGSDGWLLDWGADPMGRAPNCRPREAWKSDGSVPSRVELEPG